jgi:hypothetical protein
MASIDRLREAASKGESYEALLGFKSILSRKSNARKDRNATVQMVVSGVSAIMDGASAPGATEDALSRAMPAVVDVASQLVDTVFVSYKAAYDAQAVEDARAVALAIFPQLDMCLLSGPESAGNGAWELSFVELPTALRARAAANFVDRVIRWSRDRTTVRSEIAPGTHAKYALHWLRGCALAVASTAAADSNGSESPPTLSPSVSVPSDAEAAAHAVHHLVNVQRLPDTVPAQICNSPAKPLAVATVNWCGGSHLSSGLPWFAVRVMLQVLSIAASVDAANDYMDCVVQVAVRAAHPAAQESLATSVQQSPVMHFARAILDAVQAKSAVAADAIVEHYASILEGGDKRLVPLAKHALAAVKCTNKAAEGGGGAGGILGMLLGGASA